MQLTFLGTGTSTGVPQIGCNCEVCKSTDSLDNRLRTSALLEHDGKRTLIDCGPDFRQQILREGSPNISSLLITHSHYDHIGGIDDLRPYCSPTKPFPIYCREDVAERIKVLMPYSFPPNLYPGAPLIDVHTILSMQPFTTADGLRVTPLPIMHTDTLEIFGFSFGKSLAYITDCKTMPKESLEVLIGVETLVINALRHEEHRSHMSLKEALSIVHAVKPQRAYLTHFSHQIGLHDQLEQILPDGIYAAYDRLTIQL